MPFILPFLPAIIGAGATIGGSLLGNKLGQVQPLPAEQKSLDLLNQGQQQGLDQSKSLFNMGTGAVQQPINYWSSILSGNRGAITSALSPELMRIGEGYAQANRTSAALNPRGGPSASFNAELPYMQQRDVSNLLSMARPQAANSLAGLGGGLIGQGANALQASTSAGRDILNTEANIRAQAASNSKSLGTGLFDIMQKYGMPAIASMFGGGGGNNLGVSSPAIPNMQNPVNWPGGIPSIGSWSAG